MKKLEQKVLKFIDEKNLIGKNDKILVGLSGGPDSVLLLHILMKYSKKFRIKLGAIHINHMLRGNEADSDEQFCRDLAGRLNIDFFSVRKNAVQFAKKYKQSLEEAGRKIRYDIFESYRKKYNYDKIATAHNCSDNAETVLLNLIKGTGMKGISGIPERRDNIIRPVLVLTKEEILEYLKKENIPYRTDMTNLNTDYDRNFIRHKIIPEIKKRMNPSLEYTLFNSSEIFRNYSGLIERLASENYSGIVHFKDEILHFNIKRVEALDIELRGEIFKSAVERNFSQQIAFNDFKKFSVLLNKQAGSLQNFSGHLSAVKERDEILILKSPGQGKFNPVKIKEGEKISTDDRVLSIMRYKNSVELNKDKLTEFISGDNLSGVFILRTWQPGDRFYPLGLKGSKKVSDFLNEQKIPSFLKRNQLVLTNKNRIVWVLGLRLDDRFKILKKTKKVLQLCLK
ncbi:MAG: tRNA lysidine(34) synthetase TilS [Ignavibacteria bacterium]